MKTTALAAAIGIALAGCGAGTAGPDPEARYRKALAATASAATVAEGSPEEKAAVDRFVDFYKVYDRPTIEKKVRTIYAANAYFRDPFHEVEGIAAIEKYFVDSTEAIEECTFEIQDVAGHAGNYYLRWVMTLRLKRAKDDPPIVQVGMTHARFDESGKVSFQQDYWDTGTGVYERLPVIGWFVRKIHARIRGD